MRRANQRPAQRISRGVAISSTASQSSGWLPDSKYQSAMTWMMYAFFFLMTVPPTILSPQTNDVVVEPNPLYRALKLLLLAGAVATVIWRLSFGAQLVRELNAFLIAFVALALLSIAWSIEPGITATRCIAVGTLCLVCASCVMVGWHGHRFQEIVRSYFTALMVGSLIFGIVAPDLAKEAGTGISLQDAWHGLLVQKNGLGHAAVITVIFWTHALLAHQTKWVRFAAGCGVAFACLILSRSSTSLFSMLFCICLLLLLLKGPKAKRPYMVGIVVVFVSIILLYSLAVLEIIPGIDVLLQPIVAVTGKDMTFSGRTAIWQVIREHIAQRPLLGTGYGAYWIGRIPRSPSYVFITKQSNFYPTEAHNGYLDVINDLGYVGLLCLLGLMIVYLRQCLRLLKFDYTQATLYLALLFEELINNLTESEWLSPTSFSFAIVTLACFALARSFTDQKLRSTMMPEPQSAVVAPPTPLRHRRRTPAARR